MCKRLTRICTASTVFSSPCWRKFTEALCKKFPYLDRICVRYLYRGSCGSVNANPELMGVTEAIISGISSLICPQLGQCSVYDGSKAYMTSLVKVALKMSSWVICSLTSVGVPAKTLRTRVRCLHIGLC